MQGYAIVFTIFCAFLLLVISVMWWAKKQETRKALLEKPSAALRERRARELGWRYDPNHEGDIRYRFAGSTHQGHAWELRYDSDSSSSSSVPKLVWAIPGLRVQQTSFEISQGRAFELMQGSGAMKVASVAASIAWAVGSTAAQDVIAFYKEAIIQPVGSVRFRSRWKIMARSLAEVDGILDSHTEALMLNWPKTVEPQFDPYSCVEISRGPKGLQIECRYDSTDMPLVEHIVKIGEAVAARLKPAGP